MNETLSLDSNRRYTYADYLTWIDNKRRELIDGFIKMMSPAPLPFHQKINGKLFVALHNIVQKNNGKCEVFFAPFDVRLPKNGETDDDEIYTVVQPDICIICDLSKIDNRGCLGAPDFVAEILSKSTEHHDTHEKLTLYETAGVREYWVVSQEGWVNVFILQPDGKYSDAIVYNKNQKVPVNIFNSIEIDLKTVMQEIGKN
jgi:Uma2 family endonuclease